MSKAKKSKALSAQTRAIVFSVIQFALREKKAKTPLLDINKAMDRVAAMTGLCRDTLSKIKKEGSTNGGVWETKVKKKRQKVITNPNEVDKINIINKIEELNKRNEGLSLRKLLKELKQENNFLGGKTSLQIVLNSMGYKWEKNQSNKKVFKKVSPEAPNECKEPKHKPLPQSFPINQQTRDCSVDNSHAEQNLPVQKLPHTLRPPHPQGPSQPQIAPGQAGPFMPRPLLLHAPHYVFNL